MEAMHQNKEMVSLVIALLSLPAFLRLFAHSSKPKRKILLQGATNEQYIRFASLSGVIASLLETEANVKNSPETEADDVTTGSAVNISDSNGDDVAGCSSKAGDGVDISVDAACDISQHVPSRSMGSSSSVSFSTSQSQTNPSIFFPSL